MSTTIDPYLQRMAEKNASDLYFTPGAPPAIKIDGETWPVSKSPLNAELARKLAYSLMSEDQQREFEREMEMNLGFSREGIGRFRVNIYRQRGEVALVIRYIKAEIPAITDLDLPKVLESLMLERKGLILVVGSTGSGKSTTLAAMIDSINQRRRGHIITIEDPVEFIHTRKKSLVSQREVGRHTPRFVDALRSALREDPDAIMVGELRDLETVSLAVTAAEMGILIFGTLHTAGAVSTIDRMINTFPPNRQAQVRNMISTSLQGVVSQQLLRRTDGEGRVLAAEVLVNNHAVGNIIREGKTDQLDNVIRSGALQGMVAMDVSIQRLLDGGLISAREAYGAANDKSRFERGVGKDD